MTALLNPVGAKTRAERIALTHARARRQTAQDAKAFDADVASPFDMGTVGATNPLTTAYVMPANARVAVSFSVPLTAGQLTVDVDGRVLGTPALAADEQRRLEHISKSRTLLPTSAIAGTVTLYVLNEWQLPLVVATGVFT